MNWFGELAVRSVSEFALDASPWLAASVRSFALGPKYARTLALVREVEPFLFLLLPRPDPLHTRRPRNTREVRLNCERTANEPNIYLRFVMTPPNEHTSEGGRDDRGVPYHAESTLSTS